MAANSLSRPTIGRLGKMHPYPRSALPVAINMDSLYHEMLHRHMQAAGLESRTGETLETTAERGIHIRSQRLLCDKQDSGTQGAISAKEIEDRPILRSGEVLEAIPGVIITQHAGGGKANQYFLRGFNLDHGTDFALFIDGMPLNLPSHAHGEGYSDMNTVIPELVQRVDYEKGPYYANVGNYGSAGSAHLEFFKALPRNFAQVEGGMYGYGRLVFGASHKLGAGNLFYGGEAYHDSGPWTHPDNYYKFNGLLTYSHGSDENGYSLTARGYHGQWHSSDQIAENAIPLVGFFGTLNSTDGGHSQRYSLQGEWHRQGANSQTRITAYGFYYDLDLFSDFTYYLTDLERGDQFEQQDRRWVAGVDANHAIDSTWFGRTVENTIGLQLRNDWIHNGLYQSEDRTRVNKLDSDTHMFGARRKVGQYPIMSLLMCGRPSLAKRRLGE